MNTKNVGIVGTIISGILLIFGIYKYNYSLSFYKASGYLTRSWKDDADNYKIMIIVCAVVLLVSVILLVSSLLKDKNVNSVVLSNITNSTQSKLKELEQIYKDNLITEEEYNSKKQELLSKM